MTAAAPRPVAELSKERRDAQVERLALWLHPGPRIPTSEELEPYRERARAMLEEEGS